MKRLLFLFLLLSGELLAQTPVFSSDYEFTMNISIGGFGNDAGGSASRFEIHATYEDGTSSEIYREHLSGLDEGEWWSLKKTVLIKANRKIMGLRIFSRRAWCNARDCDNGREGSRYISTITYPCNSQTFTGVFAEYHSNSRITFSIKPLSNVHVLKLNTFAMASKKYYITEFQVRAYYTDGSSETVMKTKDYNLSVNEKFSSEHIVVYESRKNINRFEVISENIDPGSPSSFGTRNFSVSTPTIPINTTYYNPFVGHHSSSYIQVQYDPVIIDTRYGPDATYTLPQDDKIQLQVPAGYPSSAYHWQYSTNGTTWNSFPATLQGTATVSFSGNDLLGADFFRYVGTNIFFRVNMGCGNAERTTYVRTLFTRLSSPKIIAHTVTPITCAGEANGRIQLQFERVLLTNELLNVFVADASTGSTISQKLDLTALEPGNYITFPGNLPAGNYTVSLVGKYPNPDVNTYTDGSNHTLTFSLSSPPPITLSTPTATNVHCHAGQDGTITVNAAGGAGNYQVGYKNGTDADFTWVPFMAATTHTITGLARGTYTLRIRDQNGCAPKNGAGVEIIQTATITEPAAPLKIDFAEVSHPTAFGYTNGSIRTITVDGTLPGNGQYNVLWRDVNGNTLPAVSNTTSPFTSIVSGIGAGVYTFQVTDNNYTLATSGNTTGCIATGTYTVTQPPLLTVAIRLVKPISCNGDADATLVADANGGVEFPVTRYQYEWQVNRAGVWTAIGETSNTATDLSAGIYKVRVIDRNGIVQESAAFTLTQPAPLIVSINKTDVTCAGSNNGTAVALISGGTAPHAVTWNTGSTALNISNLKEDTYTAQVIDAHGCRVNDFTEILTPAPLVIRDAVVTYPTAFGYTNGTINALVEGGTPASGQYNVVWRDQDGNGLASITNTTAPFNTRLHTIGEGAYTLEVTDNNYASTTGNKDGCIATATYTVIQPPQLTVEVEEMAVISCKGVSDGQLYAKAAGGIEIPVSRYQYRWLKNTASGWVDMSITDSLLRNVPAGEYRIRITDNNGIVQESTPFNLKEPELLTLSLASTPVTCFNSKNGSVTATIQGGTLPYSTLWNTGSTALALKDLAGGTYSTTITDAHNCTVADQVTLVMPEQLRIQETIVTHPLAYNYTDGSVKATVVGGTPLATGHYNVTWKDTNGNSIPTVTNTAAPFNTLLHTIGDGTYTVEITDANYALTAIDRAAGCRATATYTVVQPPLLTVEVLEEHFVSCKNFSDGRLYARAQGGIEIPLNRYQYQWYKSTGAGWSLMAVTDSLLNNIPAGVYKVSITDKNGIVKESAPFTLVEPELLTVDLSSTPALCNGSATGTAAALINGGTAPYTIQWSTGNTELSIRNITEGSYFTFVTDTRHCQVKEQVIVTTPNSIVINNLVVKQPTCIAYCDGAISYTVSGGVPPYSYRWNTGATTAGLSALCAGTYTLTVTDANGCFITRTFSITDPAPVPVHLGPDRTLCAGQVFNSNAAIPDPGAVYQWSSIRGFTSTAATVTLKEADEYRVQVTDSKGCIGRDTIIIRQSAALIAAEFVATTQAFKGEKVAFVNISTPAPEAVEWMVPAGATVVSRTNYLLELQFEQMGSYTVSLKARVGNCEKQFNKNIAIIEGTPFADPGAAQDPFIKEFTVSPNPNNGAFRAKITLQEAARIKLRLMNVLTNSIVHTQEQGGSREYTLSFNENLAAGTYVLILETAKGSRVHKVIIQ
jgi:hypothetical protein